MQTHQVSSVPFLKQALSKTPKNYIKTEHRSSALKVLRFLSRFPRKAPWHSLKNTNIKSTQLRGQKKLQMMSLDSPPPIKNQFQISPKTSSCCSLQPLKRGQNKIIWRRKQTILNLLYKNTRSPRRPRRRVRKSRRTRRRTKRSRR